MRLRDDDLAMVMESKVQKFRNGELSREDLRDDMFELLSDMDGVMERRGPLQSQGRVSFGRSWEGHIGRALFIPEEDEDQ